MRRLEEIEARAKAATNAPWAATKRKDKTALVYATHLGPMRQIVPVAETSNTDAGFIAAAREEVPWLCEKLREAVALLGELPASHLPELNHRRDALLAALDEVTR